MAEHRDYVDFEVNIDKISEDTYQVRVNSLGGVAEVRFSDPFSADKRMLIRQTLTTAALRASARMRSSSAAEITTMKDLGSLLFKNAFQDEVRGYYYTCLARAAEQSKGLRLRLALDPTISDLPWEFLFSPEKEFLWLNPDTPIVRYIELPNPAPPLKMELPLQILVVIASPQDQIPLDTEAERARIENALAPLVEEGMVQVQYLEGADTWPRLIDALRPNKTHILHFIGHGAFNEDRREGVLMMENVDGTTKMVGSELMNILLQGKSRLRLAILNSCLGTQASQAEPLSSVAVGMVRAGIPAVMAMQFEVSDHAAQIIAGTFYKSLALNFPVDLAMTEARREIFLLDQDSLEWATPVLFMQVPSGRLFDVQDIPEEVQKSSARIDTGQMDNVVRMLYRRADDYFQQRNWEESLRYFEMVDSQRASYKDTSQRISELKRLLGVAAAPAGAGVSAEQKAEADALPDLNARAEERYQAGLEAATRGDWEAAITGFRGALMFVPDYKDAAQQLKSCQRRLECVQLYDQVQQLYQEKKYALSLQTLEKIRGIEPLWVDSADMQRLNECGVTYTNAIAALRRGEREKGATLLREVIKKCAHFDDVIARLDNLAAGGTGLFGESLIAAGQGAAPQAAGTPAPPGQQAAAPPANERVYQVRGLDLPALAEEIRQVFLAQGHENQVIEQDDTLIVQGKKGGWRSLVGMGQAATVILTPTEEGLKASVGGGKWLEQGAAIAVSMFVLWPLFITGGVGMAQQKMLLDKLWNLVEQHVTARGGRRLK